MITFEKAKELLLEKSPNMRIKKCIEFADLWLFSLVAEDYLGDSPYMTGVIYPGVLKENGEIIGCNVALIPDELWKESREIDV